MTIKELENKRFKCLDCVNHKIGSLGGSFSISINCHKLDSPLWVYEDNKIRNCKHFITEEQYKREKKLKKIINNVI